MTIINNTLYKLKNDDNQLNYNKLNEFNRVYTSEWDFIIMPTQKNIHTVFTTILL
ncbi:MAG TPA: hypothetical protein PLI27_04405 [Ignavibacteriales bacterium]|nr:hypothetical protein [Ignavibacteriales bacterium]